MKDSTKRVSKELGLENAERTVHFYMYARYLPYYIYKLGERVGLVEKAPKEEIPPEVEEMIEVLTLKVSREVLSRETSTYHGKVVPLKHAEDLLRIEEDIELRDLEKVIPYKVARDIVMVNPQNIVVVDCACRLLKENPCRPLDVCLAVGDPFASFLLEHEVLGARKIDAEEALDILRREDERGHVHSAYFKDVTGGRFYAICNCCSCCCMGMQAWLEHKTPIIAPSGYAAKVDEDCTGCGDCAEICPFGAIDVDGVAVVDEERCMGCGVCENACETGSIKLVLDPSKGDPLDIEKLLAEERERESRG